jgi:hypothetical protein
VKYVLAGSSGFLGKSLAADLVADGHEVTRLVRRAPSRPDEVRWDPAQGQLDPAALQDADVLVNVAGANIGRPWTPTYRHTIRESRVSTNATLAAASAQLDRPPVFITQSGIGGYGQDCGDEILTEESPLGDGFLSDVVRVWEGAADPAREAGSRVVAMRTGVVLARSAPAFQLLSLPFRLGVGGRLGSETDKVSGPVNVTLPNPVRNEDFSKALAAALHRPALIPVPSFVLKTVLGEFAWELIGSNRALPTKLLDTGFTFSHPTHESALTAALAR